MKKILLFIGQVLLLFFIGFLTRECWRIYREQKKIEQVTSTGARTLVKITDIAHGRQSLRDAIFNARYITFTINGRQHTMRYTQDTIFLQEGATVPVIYSPSLDEAVQPGKEMRSRDIYKTSPIIHWTVVKQFSGPNAALFFFTILAALFLVLLSGFLANITGLGLIRWIGDTLIMICAIGGAIYVSYNALNYWRYYSHISSHHTSETVRVEDISREAALNNDHSSSTVLYYIYTARVNFHGDSRVIAVGETDYDHVKAGDNLDTWYDQEKDDLLSPHFKPAIYDFIFPIVVWAIVIYAIAKRRRRDHAAG